MMNRNIILCLCFACFGFKSYAQDDFLGVYILVKTSVIYVGVENTIAFTSNYSPKDYTVSIDKGGKIITSGFMTHAVIVDSPGNYMLTFRPKRPGTSFSYTLRAKYFPLPWASIHGRLGGRVSLSSLRNTSKLELVYEPTVDFDIRASVMSFKLERIARSGATSTISNSGAGFSQKTRDFVNSCKAGDILMFKEIIGAGVSQPTLNIRDAIFYLEK